MLPSCNRTLSLSLSPPLQDSRMHDHRLVSATVLPCQPAAVLRTTPYARCSILLSTTLRHLTHSHESLPLTPRPSSLFASSGAAMPSATQSTVCSLWAASDTIIGHTSSGTRHSSSCSPHRISFPCTGHVGWSKARKSICLLIRSLPRGPESPTVGHSSSMRSWYRSMWHITCCSRYTQARPQDGAATRHLRHRIRHPSMSTMVMMDLVR